ncbi:hypothetical protein GTP41_06765 [Pseudoduganella sp. DS3]|uniref:Polyhydroxybutyrate depolymerase n=1 Tax=Pseudoduganella guangdongensis TaxID=2692179 RepID=A0A6N9HEJ0_9BURK|nr:PHB depolymerase family esterase [Pseudoduganella guangdongensis]MYN01799.1 hypothetical protein [Pseudoduganella guangdongensis]
MKILLLIVALCLPAAAMAQEQRLTHQDVKRKYIVYTPASYAEQTQRQFPVVINYHGGGMTMREQMLYTQMNRTAEREHFIVVYPQGIKQDWNVGFEHTPSEGPDDIGFTEAMLAKLKQDFRIDPRRVYATGLSRGGFFSLRLAAELPHLFAAVAAVGATTPHRLAAQAARRGRVGVLHLHGTADQIVAFAGKDEGYLSANASYQYWLKNNGITDAAMTERSVDTDQHDGTSVAFTEQSQAGVGVALVTVRNGGHTWPGADAFNVGLPLGRTSRDIDANGVIWDFLSRHRQQPL